MLRILYNVQDLTRFCNILRNLIKIPQDGGVPFRRVHHLLGCRTHVLREAMWSHVLLQLLPSHFDSTGRCKVSHLSKAGDQCSHL